MTWGLDNNIKPPENSSSLFMKCMNTPTINEGEKSWKGMSPGHEGDKIFLHMEVYANQVLHLSQDYPLLCLLILYSVVDHPEERLKGPGFSALFFF